jgi:ABC-type dipeptide/oligopeptide/nickel transport system ATPase subunit
MSLLEVENLVVEFQTASGPFRAVNGVSLKVNEGEVLAIVGESGSGKSVSMLAAMGLLPWTAKVTADKLQFNGIDLLGMSSSERRRIVGKDIAMIFQEPIASLNPCFTVGFQIEEVLRLHLGLDKAARRARAIELFELVGIPNPAERLSHFPHQMSGGQCQRVMIAIALSCNPKLLIADEPTTALDVTIQKQPPTASLSSTRAARSRRRTCWRCSNPRKAPIRARSFRPCRTMRPATGYRRLPSFSATTRSLQELSDDRCSRSQKSRPRLSYPGQPAQKGQDRSCRQGRQFRGRSGQDTCHRRRERLRQVDLGADRHDDRSGHIG